MKIGDAIVEAYINIGDAMENKTTQIELQHICNGCTELIVEPNPFGQPFCAVDKCIKEFYKDDYLAYQDNEIAEMRRKK